MIETGEATWDDFKKTGGDWLITRIKEMKNEN
jgi:hypothetical protein